MKLMKRKTIFVETLNTTDILKAAFGEIQAEIRATLTAIETATPAQAQDLRAHLKDLGTQRDGILANRVIIETRPVKDGYEIELLA
jgi:hypothetical protein